MALARDGATGTATSNYTSATGALFVGAATGDLHLKSTATVVIDKGSAAQAPSDDWDGEARPFGAAADIGADEYRPSTISPSPSAPTNLRVVPGDRR